MLSRSHGYFTQEPRVFSAGTIPMATVHRMNIDDTDMINIDVEGYEMEVHKGAIESLKNTQYLMIDLNNNTKN